MRRYVIPLLFVFLFLSNPYKTKAVVCENNIRVKYQELAKNISLAYEYIEENDTIKFNIIISNINEKLIIKDVLNNSSYNYTNSEIVLKNFNENTSYKFEVYANDYLCNDSSLYTHYINLPPYNKYYKDEVCKDAENYSLCNKWTNITMSYEDFKLKVENYKKTTVVEEVETETIVENIFDKVIDFYSEYYYYILPSIIVIVLITIRINVKKDDLF